MDDLIAPYGSSELGALYVEDAAEREELVAEAARLPSMVVNSATAANAVMLGAGYFTPLPGFMNRADALGCAVGMHTAGGLFWPTPILNCSPEIPTGFAAGKTVALRDPNLPGEPVIALQDLEDIEQLSSSQLQEMTQNVFGTTDPKHPGVANFLSAGAYIFSGAIRTLHFSYFPRDFPDTFHTAGQIRDQIRERGWHKVVAFQTRNPMHRAHEELCKIALETTGADGVLIHMLLGKLKPGDIPAAVRDAAIRKMVEMYFPPNTVLVSGYGFDMLYAGPREAVLHAIFRQNCGCTHLIVGRDHAGVGDYYGPFAAQEIFDQAEVRDALQIEIFAADHTAWSKKLNRIVMMRDAPDHGPEDYILLSGTRVREMLAAGESLPEEFARPEVAQILSDYYRSQKT